MTITDSSISFYIILYKKCNKCKEVFNIAFHFMISYHFIEFVGKMQSEYCMGKYHNGNTQNNPY